MNEISLLEKRKGIVPLGEGGGCLIGSCCNWGGGRYAENEGSIGVG